MRQRASHDRRERAEGLTSLLLEHEEISGDDVVSGEVADVTKTATAERKRRHLDEIDLGIERLSEPLHHRFDRAVRERLDPTPRDEREGIVDGAELHFE